MSESTSNPDNPIGVDDDQLPDDLVPSDDNPLAKGLDDGEKVGDLLEDGKPAEQDGDGVDPEV